MLFDRILEDVLGFIRRLLWWRSEGESVCPQPFQSMQTIAGEFGVISLMIGRDTPRAVRTWAYSPKRLNLNSTRMVASQVPDDLHIYLDFLGPLSAEQPSSQQADGQTRKLQHRAGKLIGTHRLQIIRASHFLNASGFYDCELLYWNDYDFYLPIPLSPETIARIVTDKLAYACLEMTDPFALEQAQWESLVQQLLLEVRGRQFAV